MHNNAQIEFGRYQFDTYRKGTVIYFENFDHEDDFWLPITNEHNLTKGPIVFLKFKAIGQGTFVLDQVRPALCPIRDLSAACKRLLPHQEGDS